MLLFERSRCVRLERFRIDIGICEQPTLFIVSCFKVRGNPLVWNPALDVITSFVSIRVFAGLKFDSLLAAWSGRSVLVVSPWDFSGYNWALIAFRKAFSWIASALIARSASGTLNDIVHLPSSIKRLKRFEMLFLRSESNAESSERCTRWRVDSYHNEFAICWIERRFEGCHCLFSSLTLDCTVEIFPWCSKCDERCMFHRSTSFCANRSFVMVELTFFGCTLNLKF